MSLREKREQILAARKEHDPVSVSDFLDIAAGAPEISNFGALLHALADRFGVTPEEFVDEVKRKAV